MRLPLLITLLFASATHAATVTIPAGTDIQTAINKQPSGTAFILPAGEWRYTSALAPKTGDSFTSTAGAILNGSKLLTSFTSSSGRWYVGGQTQGGSGSSLGSCMSGYSGCGFAQDVFRDDQPLQHVTSLSAVKPGTFYFDYKADRIYLGDNPTGHKIETSIAPAAFESSVNNVTIKGLDIQKFATPSQSSAIQQDGGSGWLVDSNYIHLNHASGVEIKTNGIARNNRINNNGQEGITSSDASNVLITGNEIAGNNWARYDVGWEAGGSKFWQTTNLTASNNNIHDNYGTGLWTDTKNTGTVYSGNTITNNYTAGISHEVSGSAKIFNNTLKNNGAVGWANLSIESSYNVEAYGNTIESDLPQAATLLVYQANREFGYSAHDDSFHDNTIIMGAAGNGNSLAGLVNVGSSSTKNIKFDFNTYYVVDSAGVKHWTFPNAESFAAFQSQGQEKNGHVYVGLPSSLMAAGGVPEPFTLIYAAIGVVLVAFGRRR